MIKEYDSFNSICHRLTFKNFISYVYFIKNKSAEITEKFTFSNLVVPGTMMSYGRMLQTLFVLWRMLFGRTS